jgi:transcriptional regulator with XRE-family HTH domain
MTRRPNASNDDAASHLELLGTVGNRIRELRIKAGLNQVQLGQKADLKNTYISELESGSANITLSTLARMAEALDVEVLDLLPERRTGGLSPQGFERLQTLLVQLITELGQFASLRAAAETALTALGPPPTPPGAAPPQPYPATVASVATKPQRRRLSR